MNFLKEVWAGYRPYLIKIAIDFLIPATLWVALFIFHILTSYLPITGWAGEFIVFLHSAATVGIVGLFAWWSVNDIIQIKGGGIECFA